MARSTSWRRVAAISTSIRRRESPTRAVPHGWASTWIGTVKS